jgi:ATP-binding cassette, subfamily B, multidrug efflux pump
MMHHHHNPGSDVAYERPFDTRLLMRMVRYIIPYKKPLIIGIIFLIIASAVFLATPYILKVAIDKYIMKGNLTGLVGLSLFYVFLRLVHWVSSYWDEYLFNYCGQKLTYDLRMDLFRHLQKLSLKFYNDKKVGWIIARLTSDISAIEEFFNFAVTTFVNIFFTLAGTMVMMIMLDLKLSLITFSILPPLAVVVLLMGRKARKAYRRARITNTDLVINLAENINGVRVTQSFAREEKNMERFENINVRNYQAQLQAAAIFSIFMPSVALIATCGLLLVLWFGGRSVMEGATSVGVLVAFVGYINHFFQPIRSLSELYNHMLNAMASAERLFGLLDTPVLVKNTPAPRELTGIKEKISFDNVWFAYDKENYVLKGVSFDILPGQTVALVGPTGAGKSSIMSLTARFYDYQKGSITIDGHELKEYSLESLRGSMGIVLQDTFLFDGSVKDNIRYGRLEATDEEIAAAARLAETDEFVNNLPEKYATNVREQGSRLSVGQKQLISFSRALLRDPKILILDEATSSIDAYMEFKIQLALRKLLANRICLVAAHRLSTIRSADLILVIEHGQIIERGNHEALMGLGGMYKNFYETRYRYLQGETGRG